jgi:hypothetical protein
MQFSCESPIFRKIIDSPRKSARASKPHFLHIQTLINMSIPSITDFSQDVTNEDDAIYWLVSYERQACQGAPTSFDSEGV